VSLIEEVLAPDDRTLVIKWKRPYTMANALNSAGTGAPDNFPPLPRSVLQAAVESGSPDAILNHPYWTRDFVGLGPYRLQNWVPGSFLETAAFSRHALGSPRIERIKLLIVPDDNAVIPFLLTGEIQLAPADGGVGAGRVRTVLEQLGSGRGTAILHPNQWRRIEAQFRPEYLGEPALVDPRVRRALAFAIDKAALNEAVYDGQAVPADSMVPPASQDGRAVDAVIAKYPFDLRRADEQMTAAGYTKGADGFYTNPASGRFSSEIKSNAGANTVAEMTILASGWRQAGFSMQDAVLPAALGQDPEARASFAGLFTNSGNLQGAINFKATLFPGSPNRLQNESRGGWSNAEYAQLSDAFNTTLDASERTRLTVEMMKIFSDQLPALSLFFGAQAWVFLADLQGPKLVASETNMSWNIHEWEMRSATAPLLPQRERQG
jgi:peptide/nickel transport system substrate-binding protein